MSCVMVKGQELDLRSLVLETPLPQLWRIFTRIVNASQVTDAGLTLTGAQAYLMEAPVIQVDHGTFWTAMNYFLQRTNAKYLRRMKRKLKSRGARED